MKTKAIKNLFSNFASRTARKLSACWRFIHHAVASVIAFFRRNSRLTDAHLVGGIIVFALTRMPVIGKVLAIVALIVAFLALVTREKPQIVEAGEPLHLRESLARVSSRISEAVRSFIRRLDRWAASAARYVAARWLFFETIIVGVFLAVLINAYVPWIGGLLATLTLALAVLYGIERQVTADSGRVVIQVDQRVHPSPNPA